jgi:hypothetical protein
LNSINKYPGFVFIAFCDLGSRFDVHEGRTANCTTRAPNPTNFSSDRGGSAERSFTAIIIGDIAAAAHESRGGMTS